MCAKKVAIKKVKKVVVKPRNNGTMTESAFWSFIRKHYVKWLRALDKIKFSRGGVLVWC